MTVAAPSFATRALHAGRSRLAASSRATPIYLTAGFEFDDFDHAANHFGTGEGFGYTRTGNPTVGAVEQQLAALESGADAVLVASGQAAVAVALLTVAGAGDHIVSSTHIYEAPAASSSTTSRGSESKRPSSTTSATRMPGAQRSSRTRARCSPSRSRMPATTSSTSPL